MAIFADSRAVMYACGYFDADLPGPHLPACAFAFLAGCIHHLAAAVAFRAVLNSNETPEPALCRVLHLPLSPALVACVHVFRGIGAGPVTLQAGLFLINFDFPFQAEGGFMQID